MKYPQILTEVHLTERFLPKGVKKCARAMYLEMIGAACSYLIDLDLSKYTAPQRKDSEYTLDENSFLFNQGSFNDTQNIITPLTQQNITLDNQALHNMSLPGSPILQGLGMNQTTNDVHYSQPKQWNLLAYGQQMAVRTNSIIKGSFKMLKPSNILTLIAEKDKEATSEKKLSFEKEPVSPVPLNIVENDPLESPELRL